MPPNGISFLAGLASAAPTAGLATYGQRKQAQGAQAQNAAMMELRREMGFVPADQFNELAAGAGSGMRVSKPVTTSALGLIGAGARGRGRGQGGPNAAMLKVLGVRDEAEIKKMVDDEIESLASRHGDLNWRYSPEAVKLSQARYGDYSAQQNKLRGQFGLPGVSQNYPGQADVFYDKGTPFVPDVLSQAWGGQSGLRYQPMLSPGQGASGFKMKPPAGGPAQFQKPRGSQMTVTRSNAPIY